MIERHGNLPISVIALAASAASTADQMTNVVDTMQAQSESVASQLAEAVTAVTTQLEAADQAATKAAAARKTAIDGLLDDITSKVDTDLETLKQDTAASLETLKKETTDNLIAALAKESEKTDDKIAELKAITDKQFAQSFCSFVGTLDTDADPPECVCDDGYQGNRCQVKTPEDCSEAPTADGPLLLMDGSFGFCSKANGGGWSLAFNLKTNEAPARDYTNTAFWVAADKTFGKVNDGTLKNDFRGDIFNNKKDYTEIMIMAHNGGNPHGFAKYSVVDEFAGAKTVNEMFAKESNVVWTTPRKSKSGGVKGLLMHNPWRNQNLYGDIFVDDFADALVVNKQSGWNAAVNLNRLATTLTNNAYSHTLAGIGGHHENGKGSYVTKYEASPIFAYCDATRMYGSGEVYTASGAHCVNGGAFKYVPVDFALYVR